MVQQALKNSPTLAQARHDSKQAQEEFDARTGATKYPTVSGNASVQEEQLNLAAYGIPFPNPSPFTLLNGSVAVSYALDFFGANRHLIEGLNAQSGYEAWQLEGARLMLAGNVVIGRNPPGAVALTNRDHATDACAAAAGAFRSPSSVYHAGGASDDDVRSQRTRSPRLQATLPPLQTATRLINDQLALLMGKSAGRGAIGDIPA